MRPLPHYLDEFEGLSVAHNFAGQNDNEQVKTVLRQVQTLVLNSLKDRVSSCDVDF